MDNRDNWSTKTNQYGETEIYWAEKPSAIISLAQSLALWCDRHLTAETADTINSYYKD